MEGGEGRESSLQSKAKSIRANQLISPSLSFHTTQKHTGGSVSGIVGAGGNCGAICFTLLFLHNKFSSTAQGFRVMGWCVMACAFAIWFIKPELLAVDPLDDTVKADASIHASEEADAVEMGNVNVEAKVSA